MLVDFEFMLAVRDCYVTTEEPPHTPETLVMARSGEYMVILDQWANLSWFAREADAQRALRKLREEVRTVGYRQTRDAGVPTTR